MPFNEVYSFHEYFQHKLNAGVVNINYFSFSYFSTKHNISIQIFYLTETRSNSINLGEIVYMVANACGLVFYFSHFFFQLIEYDLIGTAFTLWA